MSYTKVRDVSPPVRSAATLDAERRYYTYHRALTPVSLTSAGRTTLGPGASSSIMVPTVASNTAPQMATQSQRPVTRHRYRPQAALRQSKPVDAEAALAVFGLLVVYVVLVVLFVATSSRPAPVQHANESVSVRPLSSNSAIAAAAPTAPVLPSLPTEIEAAKPVVLPPLFEVNPQSATNAAPLAAAAPSLPPVAAPNTAPKPAAVARREKALDLLKKARESQSDTVVYRQTLAELVRSYGDTPAGAAALNLLAATEPATSINSTPSDTPDETPAVKPSDDKPAPAVRYGPRSLD